MLILDKKSLVKKYESRKEVQYIFERYGKKVKSSILLILLENNLKSIVKRYILLHERYKRWCKKRATILYGSERGSIEFEKWSTNHRKNNRLCVEYWIAKGLTDVEAKAKISEIQNLNSLESYVKRYGTEIGQVKYNEYKQRYVDDWHNLSEEVKQQRLAKMQNFWQNSSDEEIAETRRKGACNYNNFIKWYGDEAESKWNEFKTNHRKNSKRCCDYWLERGYSEEGAREKVAESQATFTLEKCLQKYGQEEGKQIWKQRQLKWRKSFEQNDSKLINQKRKDNASSGMYCDKYFIKFPEHKERDAYIYLMEFLDVAEVKVGITTRTPEKRFNKRNVMYTILFKNKMTLYEAFSLEQKVCKHFDEHKLSDGHSSKESFDIQKKEDILQFIKQEIKTCQII